MTQLTYKQATRCLHHYKHTGWALQNGKDLLYLLHKQATGIFLAMFLPHQNNTAASLLHGVLSSLTHTSPYPQTCTQMPTNTSACTATHEGLQRMLADAQIRLLWLSAFPTLGVKYHSDCRNLLGKKSQTDLC